MERDTGNRVNTEKKGMETWVGGREEDSWTRYTDRQTREVLKDNQNGQTDRRCKQVGGQVSRQTGR